MGLEDSKKNYVSDDELKEVVKVVANIELLVSNLSNGFSFKEIGEILKVINAVPLLKEVAPKIIPEWLELDDSQRMELIQYVAQNCKFPASLSLEIYVMKTLQAAVLLSQIVQLIKA